MRHYLWALRPYFRQVAGELLLGALAGILMNTLVVLPAIFLGRAIDMALALERGQAAPADVVWAALAFVGGTLATELPRLGKRWWLITANGRIRANLRADAFRGVLAWPMAQLQQTPVGDVMARIIGDVDTLGVGIREFLIETWDTLLFSFSFVLSMLIYDPGLTALALLPVPLAMGLAQAAGRWVRGRTAASRAVNALLTGALQEHLSGVRVLRLFGRTRMAVERVAELSGRQAEANLAIVRLRDGLKPVYTTLMMVGIVLVIWLGGQRVIEGALTIGAFVGYVELYMRFVSRAHRIPQMINAIQAGGAAYARLEPLLAPPLAVGEEPPYASFRPGVVAGLTRPLPHPAASESGPIAVSLRGVTFRYPGAAKPALSNVTLDFPAGALVAVTGPVGAGKSALARALLGLWPLEAGRVRLNETPIEMIPAAERAARIGYLPQDPHLFSGTVHENILLATGAYRPGSLDPLLEWVRLDSDLRTFPAGIETQIGELGIRVSGGQRQRIGLARAIASARPHWPGLLVLDDPFSSVDVTTEAQIIAALRTAVGPDSPPGRRATIVLCSHRLAAFPQADQVIVLDGGRAVEQGSHTQLMEAGGLYARIFRAQHQIEPQEQLR
jgi:ABC-type multidrug transport system fused ATPase/permease subunit